MSKTWYGHHIETIKGEDYVLHKDYTEIQDKLYKSEKILDKIKEYVLNNKLIGPPDEYIINGNIILKILGEIE